MALPTTVGNGHNVTPSLDLMPEKPRPAYQIGSTRADWSEGLIVDGCDVDHFGFWSGADRVAEHRQL
jgi:hypothetical protein